MKKITLYFYTDPETGKIVSTLKEMPLSSSQPKYWLAADDGCYLRNNKYHISCKSIIVPVYEFEDWEERQL